MPDWIELSLVESGGFAGLRRGATVLRAELSVVRARHVDRALDRLAKKRPRGAVAYPDAQTLTISVRRAAGSWAACFDTADLPDAASELLDVAPLRPLPAP